MCYRHPNREAGRRCTRCGKPACAECLVQASVGSHCLDCARLARPDTKTRARYWNARQTTLVTYALILTNVLVFVYVLLETPRSVMGDVDAIAYRRLGLMRDLLRSSYPIDIPDGLPGQWYRLVSSGFLHYGIIHLAFNMYALYMLGQTLEPMLGRLRFGMVYFACLLGGSAGALLLQPHGLHGGASGAVFGLFGLIIVGYLQRGINPLTTSLGGVLIVNVLLSFRGGISFGGHLGGAVAGMICGWVMMAPAQRRVAEKWTYVTPILVGLGSIAVAVATTS
jgi:membrane associated rhomboid family serine protease